MQNPDFAKRYYPTVLLLPWQQPNGRLVLDRTERPYDAFHAVVKPLLRGLDYEVQPAEKRRGRGETRWHIGLREGLLNMREDRHPEDGRVRYLKDGAYELTERGRASLESFLGAAEVPLEWLELETEELEDGTQQFHYRHPMTGDELVSFGSGPTPLDDISSSEDMD